MIKFDETFKKLLDEIQKDFPLSMNPYEVIAQKCGLTENEVINKLKYLLDNNIIREISVILNAEKLNYHSTLVAAKLGEQELDKAVRVINKHPGVSHNYLRDFEYNVWFTLSIKKENCFSNELEKMFSGLKVEKYLILSAIKTFKIGVNFSFLKNNNEVQQMKTEYKEKKLTEIDKHVINLLQNNLKIVENPWEEIIKALKITPDTLFSIISNLKNRGVIKRISGVLHHRNAGYQANGMACFKIAEKDVTAAGEKAAIFSEVSHCYQRTTYPDWQYSLFCMVHSESKEKCDDIIKNISNKINCDDYIILYSEKEFKKERTKYTVE